MITATILVNKEILAHGEASFAQPFACGECVDKYRLTVFPYLTGAGRPLFADATEPHPLELVSSTAFADECWSCLLPMLLKVTGTAGSSRLTRSRSSLSMTHYCSLSCPMPMDPDGRNIGS
jgi:hypothetical protein